MTDISAFGFADDVEFARYLVKDVGVAAVPGSSFYKSRRRTAPSCGSVSARKTRRSRRGRAAGAAGRQHALEADLG